MFTTLVFLAFVYFIVGLIFAASQWMVGHGWQWDTVLKWLPKFITILRSNN